MAAIAFGGALAGLGGAYFSLALTPMWADRLTAGRGWIALALVVFAAWKPGRLLLGRLSVRRRDDAGAAGQGRRRHLASAWSMLAMRALPLRQLRF